MQLLTATIPPNADIALIGDTHIGTTLAHDEALDAVIDWVGAERNRFFAFMGDAIEAITTDDKRFDITTHDMGAPLPQQQADDVVARFMPIRRKCIAWLLGNHEYTLHRVSNYAAYIATHLQVPYGTWTAKVTLNCAKGRIGKLFLCHASVRGTFKSNAKDYEQQQANMKASLKRSLAQKAADCILMATGHTHKLLVVDPAQRLILRDDGTDVKQAYLGAGDGASDYIEPDRRWYVNTGCFLKTYGQGVAGYGERAGYDPTEMGYPIVHIRKGKVDSVEKVVV